MGKSILNMGISALALAVSAMGCAQKEKPHTAFLSIGSEFAPYVQNFIDESVRVGRSTAVTDLILRFGSTPTMNETGVCEITENETPIITINQTLWDQKTPNERQEVVFHELGHCVLRRVHQNGEARDANNFAIPDSVMYPYALPHHTYTNNMNYYHNELFSRSNQF